jgi:hypothetical protein
LITKFYSTLSRIPYLGWVIRIPARINCWNKELGDKVNSFLNDPAPATPDDRPVRTSTKKIKEIYK